MIMGMTIQIHFGHLFPHCSRENGMMEYIKEMLRVQTRKEIMQYSFIHLAIQSSVHSHSLVELI